MKLRTIMALIEGIELLHEPYPFKLAKSRLQIQARKMFYSITPNDMRLWVEKATTCGPTERPII